MIDVRRSGLLVIAVLSAVACGSSADATSPTSSCVVPPTADCKPLVDPPTFDAIYAQIIQPTCASGGAACHSAGAPATRIAFDDENVAHAMLLGQNGADVRVLPNDAACSPLMKRILATDPAYRMPRGSTPLSDAETCAITLWIDRGASR